MIDRDTRLLRKQIMPIIQKDNFRVTYDLNDFLGFIGIYLAIIFRPLNLLIGGV